MLAFFEKKTLRENWKIRTTLLQISLQPILGEVCDEKLLWQKVTALVALRTGLIQDASKCFKFQIGNVHV